MPPFRDDHILIIYPGSQTILAQLGLPESFTPAKVRIPSRMFPGIEEGTWTATKIREAREGEKEDLIAKQKAAMGSLPDEEEGDEDEDDDGDEEMEDGTDTKAEDSATTEAAPKDVGEDATEATAPKKEEAKKDTPAPAIEGEDAEGENEEDEDEDMGEDGVYVEDDDDEEGAVWCIKEGKVVDWGCFFALLQHVHETINPTFHTPILMLYPPAFDDRDKELLTQFVFEKLKAPGFAIMDASLAVLWAYGISTATVIDVGYEKTDITPVIDFLVQERARTTVSNCGGDSMTKHLAKLLPNMTAQEVEQLKRSPICEILSAGMPLPTAGSVNAAIAAGEKNKKVADPDNMDLDVEDDDGTINVAAIVASGKTREFLAKKEKEKRGEFERRLPNREREFNTFWLVEKKKPGEEGQVIIDEPMSAVATTAPLLPLPEKKEEEAQEVKEDVKPTPVEPEAAPVAPVAPVAEGEKLTEAPATEPSAPAPATDAAAPAPTAPVTEATAASASTAPTEGASASTTDGSQAPTAPTAPTAPIAAASVAVEDETERRNKEKEKRKEERRAAAGGLPPLGEDEQYHEVEVGIERFRAAECGILHEIADNLWRVLSRVEDVGARSELWGSLVVVGNGSKVRGFKDALLSTIQGKYQISPSSNTIFTSELPSGLSTPLTGASTPNPAQNPGNAGGPSQPNPLLVAATTHAAQNPYMAQQQSHHGHTQTPTNIKFVKAPEYFPEWKDAGFEEVGFLGAQVAAKVLFVVDQGASHGFLTRVEYNEGGPGAIHGI